MPRIRKLLPVNRADYSFGDLVYWHLFEFGTRPNLRSDAKVGKPWRPKDICTRLGKTERTLRNWIKGESLPDDISDLCQALFGDNPVWDDARLELQKKLDLARPAFKSKTSAPSVSAARTEAAEASASAGQAEAGDIAPTEGEAEQPSNPDAEPVAGGDGGKGEEATRPPNAGGSRELVHLRPIVLRASSDNRGNRQKRRAVASIIAGLAIFAGLYDLMFGGRQGSPPEPVRPKLATVPEPKRSEPPKIQPEPIRPVVPAPASELPKEVAPLPPAPVVPTEEERKQAERDRIDREHMEARRRAFEAEELAREQAALRLDQENDRQKRELATRQEDARIVAGMGFRLQEHRRVAGASFRHVLSATVGDCANACTSDPTCDAFGYYREQYGPDVKRRRVCYFFKKPFEVSNYPGYVHGELIAERRAETLDEKAEVATPIIRVQAKTSEPKSDDGLIRCATGPVKVTGFKITCDQTLGGGTTLGSTRLSYTVANINECASKCKPVAKCVGFTFNAGDREGQHACIIFGPTPEARESKGWISGIR